MKRRRFDQKRISAFVQKMAERDMRRMKEEWVNDTDPGLACDFDFVRDCFIPWHDYRILPSAGGYYDQEPGVMDALLDLEYRVAYTVAHYGRLTIDQLPSWDDMRRERQQAANLNKQKPS